MQVYFDNAATTPPRPEVVQAMLPFLEERWGNPSSLHVTGIAALEGMERAREHLAALLGCQADELIFTGSGTEADNHALLGCVQAGYDRGRHVITSCIEHHAVLHTAEFLAKWGAEVTSLPVDRHGLVDPDAVRRAIRKETVLVSIMHANNEIGTIQPIAEIGSICRERGVLFHTDAVQTVGHVPLDVETMHVDLLSLSAHKLYGPKGIGALYLRKGVELPAFVHGGGQELHRRAGTENVPGIVGLGEAARLAREELAEEAAHSSALRDRLIAGVPEATSGVMLTGHPTQRLPNNASFCVDDVDGQQLMLALDTAGFAVSTGSACTAGSAVASHVLLALGIPPARARGSLRVTVGRGNTEEEVARFVAVLPDVVTKLRP